MNLIKFLLMVIGILLTDILQTVARGHVFTPWFYLPFVLHYVAVGLLAIFVKKPGIHRWIAWYLFLSIAIWSFAVRRFLA